MVDPIKNFAKVTVSIPYDNLATTILVNSGDGSKLPNPSTDGAFNLVWWNSTDYPDPADDPYKEIVRCTARSTDTLTIVRAQENTSVTNKNTVGKIYKMILSITAKVISDLIQNRWSYSYLIYNSGGNTYAENGSTGLIDFRGSDAKTVINNAITALTSGGSIFIKEGTYLISDKVFLDTPNIQITGTMGTILKWNGVAQGGHVMEIGASADNCEVSDLAFDMNLMADYSIKCIASGGSTDNLKISRCHMYGGAVGSACLGMARVKRGIVDSCIFEGSNALGINVLDSSEDLHIVNNFADGLGDSFCSVGTATGFKISRVTVSNNTVTNGTGFGVEFYGNVDGGIASNNIIKNNNRGLISQTAGGYSPDNIIFSNNNIFDCIYESIRLYSNSSKIQVLGNNVSITTATTNAIEANGNVSKEVIIDNNRVTMNTNDSYGCIVMVDNMISSKLSISNNQLYGGASGILINDLSKGAIISNNFIENAYYEGMELNGLQHASIIGNICRNNGQHGSSGYASGIALANRSSTYSLYNLIEGNVCYDDQETKTQQYGIQTKDNSDYNTIVGNMVTGNLVTGGISYVGSNNIIKNNNGYNTEKDILSGTFAIDSTGIKTVVIAHGLAITPAIQDCYVAVLEVTAVDDWGYNLLKVVSTDATNVTIKINVSSASSTASATAKIGLRVGNP